MRAKTKHAKHVTSSDNTSGYIGLHRSLRYKSYGLVVYWVAVFPPSTGKPSRIAFMAGKRTECDAFRLAAKSRYERCGDLVQISRQPNAPCKPDVPVIRRFTE